MNISAGPSGVSPPLLGIIAGLTPATRTIYLQAHGAVRTPISGCSGASSHLCPATLLVGRVECISVRDGRSLESSGGLKDSYTFPVEKMREAAAATLTEFSFI